MKLKMITVFAITLFLAISTRAGTILSFDISPGSSHKTGRWDSIETTPSVERKLLAKAEDCEFKEDTTEVVIDLFCQVNIEETPTVVKADVYLSLDESVHTSKIAGKLKIQVAQGKGGGQPPSADWDVTGLDIVDLAVDSNNDNGYDNPIRDKPEYDVEEIAPGKIFTVNNSNLDFDTVPDFADGF